MNMKWIKEWNVQFNGAVISLFFFYYFSKFFISVCSYDNINCKKALKNALLYFFTLIG